jgi:hypothetical protein
MRAAGIRQGYLAPLPKQVDSVEYAAWYRNHIQMDL